MGSTPMPQRDAHVGNGLLRSSFCHLGRRRSVIMPLREEKSRGRWALMCLGILIVSIQLMILRQMFHATFVDISDMSSPILDAVKRYQPQKKSAQNRRAQTDENQVVQAAEKQATRKVDNRIPDGSFNGINIYYSEEPTDSTVSCVGENYQKDAWMYRSCQFRHLCFDVEEKDYVLFQSPEERLWMEHPRNRTLVGSPSTMNVTVALGGLNPKWTEKAWPKLEWFPKVIPGKLTEGYYELPQHITWVPFHSFAGFNAGHLLWDDFLPLYTLLSMFGMLDSGMQPLFTRYVLNDEPMWASCDLRDDTKKKCESMFTKFLSAMGVDPNTFSSTEDFRLETKRARKSKYVCARQGAAGIGMLTDHGVKAHGWDPKDYVTTHNHGRGPLLYAFRNFMLQNLNISTKLLSSEAPFNVTFSQFSSKSYRRRTDFQQQLKVILNDFSPNELQVAGHVMNTLSLHEQVQIASESAIFVTSCGGGAVTATFLPRGATLIVYYDGSGSVVKNRKTFKPARLDWDLFNHMSYLRVHWLPTQDMDKPDGLKLFSELIRNELHVIEHQ